MSGHTVSTYSTCTLFHLTILRPVLLLACVLYDYGYQPDGLLKLLSGIYDFPCSPAWTARIAVFLPPSAGVYRTVPGTISIVCRACSVDIATPRDNCTALPSCQDLGGGPAAQRAQPARRRRLRAARAWRAGWARLMLLSAASALASAGAGA